MFHTHHLGDEDKWYTFHISTLDMMRYKTEILSYRNCFLFSGNYSLITT